MTDTQDKTRTPRRRASVTGLPSEVLTELERKFVDLVAAGKKPSDAALAVGMHRGSEGKLLMERPEVRRAVRDRFARVEGHAHMTRAKVMNGLMEAIEMAKTISDPTAMISGYREIAKMCGYYAVQTQKVEVSVTGEVGVRNLSNLSDADLLKIARGETLEGEFTQIVGQGAVDLAYKATEVGLND